GADPTNGLTARVAGPVMVDGNVSAEARGGDLLEALSAATIDIGSHFRVSLEPGSRFSYYESDGKLTFRPYSGTATFVTGGRDAFLVGDGWFGRMATGTVAELSVSSDALVVHVADGVLWVQVGREPEIRLTKDLPAIRLSLAGTPSISEEDLLPPAWNGSGPGSAPLSAPPASPVLGAGASAAPPQTLPAALSAPPATVPQPGQVPASNAKPPALDQVIAPPAPSAPGPAAPASPSGEGATSAAPPPFAEGGAFEDGNPAGVTPPGSAGGQTDDQPAPPADPPVGGNGSSNQGGGGNGNGNANGGGNGGGAGNGNGNANGNANGPANGNGNAANAPGHTGAGSNGTSGTSSAPGLARAAPVTSATVNEAIPAQDGTQEPETATDDEGAALSGPGKASPPGNAFGHTKDHGPSGKATGKKD
ncbi:MAG TPA: hypothetical protein PJ994_09390, partial [Tepidiformaceae bacterium]|nr:hypothetical protein [Tepidiformaceae bacterium]